VTVTATLKEKVNPMTKRNLIGLAILCSVLLAAGACGKGKAGSNAAKLIGTWHFQGEKTVEATEMFKQGKPEFKKRFAAMLDKATITITKDKMKMEGMGKPQVDTYKVVSESGKNITVETTDEKGKKEKITITFLSDTEIKVEKQEKTGKMIFFAKKK
jgi:hypothetical protein